MSTTPSSLNATTDEELRLSALHHATQTAPSGATADAILERAETYLAFLTGSEYSRAAKTEQPTEQADSFATEGDGDAKIAASLAAAHPHWSRDQVQAETAALRKGRTVHVHFDRPDTDREPGELGRQRRLVRSICRSLRGIGLKFAAEYVEATYGELE